MTTLLVTALGGSLLVVLAALTVRLVPRGSAAFRSLVWCAALLAAGVLPLLCAIGPRVTVPVLPHWVSLPPPEAEVAARPVTEPVAGVESPSAADSSPSRSIGAPAAMSLIGATNPGTDAGEPRRAVSSRDLASILLGLWGLGFGLVLAPLVVGIARMTWITARASRPEVPGLRARHEAAAGRMGLSRAPRLLVTGSLRLPVVWHLVRPVVLVPAAFTQWTPARQTTVLLHELAHVRRGDGRMQLLVTLALAVQWFDPLAWWAAARWRQQREQACDDRVLEAGVKPSRYAADLVSIGTTAGSHPLTLALAPSLARRRSLAGRVRAILDPQAGRRSPHRRTSMSITLVALVLAAALSGVRPVPATATVVAPAEATSTASPPSSTEAPPTATPPQGVATRRASPSIDELVQMRIHGVTPEYIEVMRDHLQEDLGIDQLVELRIHGASPDWVREMADVLGDRLTQKQVVEMRIHGVSPEFVEAMRDHLQDDLGASQLAELRIHGASPNWVREMAEVLGERLTQRQAVEMRIHGVSPEATREFQQLLPDERIVVRDLVQMRIHGVTPQLVRELREDGYEDLTVEELVKIRIHGLDRIITRRRGGSR